MPSFSARKYLILWSNYYFSRKGGRVLVEALQDLDKSGHCGSAADFKATRAESWWSRSRVPARKQSEGDTSRFMWRSDDHIQL